MGDYQKSSNDVSSNSVDSLNTNSCNSSKNSMSTNESLSSIKYEESASGFSTPPTSSADTCDSGFTEFFSIKAGTSSQPSLGVSQNISGSTETRNQLDCRDTSSVSDSDSDSKWKTEDVAHDSFEDSESGESDFQSKEKVDMSRINYRWLEWCHKQLVSGVDPRTVLRKIFRNGEFPVPQGVSDRELWSRIASFVTQPPARTRLPDINSIDHVVRLLTTCKNIIVLTGAGVSVSCGIPDFRSRSGIYARLRTEIPEIKDPHEIFDIRFFSKDPRPFFKFAKELYPGSFTPSLCHRFIRLLERKEKLLRNYSQNIDTLERLAGIEKVIECHGSFATASCTKCGIVVSAEEIRDEVLSTRIPMCAICNPVNINNDSPTENQSKRISHSSSMTEGYKDLYGMGILKPDIVFFGESLPEFFHPAINADRQQCDCLLVIGSSLKVRPVSLIPEFLKGNVPQILINRERIGNYVFDIELLGDADIIVNQLCRMLGGDWSEICEQPELKLSSTIDFNPETNKTVNLPLTRTPATTMKLSESGSSQQNGIKSPSQSTTKTTDSTSDVISLPTVSKNDDSVDHAIESTCPKEERTSGGQLKAETDDGKSKTVFVFSIENVPGGCYYSTQPHKYIFPGSTHKWYGTGKDREEIFEDDDDDEYSIGDDDEDDDDDEEEDCCETESSTNHGENSDSNDVADSAPKPSSSVLLGKRVGSPETPEGVKQQKIDD